MRERAVHHIRLVQFDDVGNEQNLSSDAGPVDRRFEFFIDDAFVRGVLIDDHQSVPRLRHDIGVVDLRARGAERMIERIGAGAAKPAAGSALTSAADSTPTAGAPTSNAACAASAKPLRA